MTTAIAENLSHAAASAGSRSDGNEWLPATTSATGENLQGHALQRSAERGPYSAYIPDRDEIRAACRRIRQSWTPQQRRQRQVTPETLPWSVPCLKLMLSDGTMDDE